MRKLMVCLMMVVSCNVAMAGDATSAPPPFGNTTDGIAGSGERGTSAIWSPLKNMEVWCTTPTTIRYTMNGEVARAYGKAGARVDSQGQRQVRAIYYYSTNKGASWSTKDSGWRTALSTGKYGYDGDRFATADWNTTVIGVSGLAGINGGGSDDKRCSAAFPLK